MTETNPQWGDVRDGARATLTRLVQLGEARRAFARGALTPMSRGTPRDLLAALAMQALGSGGLPGDACFGCVPGVQGWAPAHSAPFPLP